MSKTKELKKMPKTTLWLRLLLSRLKWLTKPSKLGYRVTIRKWETHKVSCPSSGALLGCCSFYLLLCFVVLVLSSRGAWWSECHLYIPERHYSSAGLFKDLTPVIECLIVLSARVVLDCFVLFGVLFLIRAFFSFFKIHHIPPREDFTHLWFMNIPQRSLPARRLKQGAISFCLNLLVERFLFLLFSYATNKGLFYFYRLLSWPCFCFS